MKLKPVSEISRGPRSIFQKGDYKANELRSLMLFYLRFALPGLLAKKYIDHFQLFSSAMYLLLKEKISPNDISEAQKKLNDFQQQYEDLYGKHTVTMNLHLIGHMPTNVTHLGPSWGVSAYGFESKNGKVVKSNTSTKDMTFQLVYKYIMQRLLQKNSRKKRVRKLH